MIGTGSVNATGNGAINIVANGADSSGASNNRGVRMNATSKIAAVNGDISITGTGGAATSFTGIGIGIIGAASQITTTGTGSIILNGYGHGKLSTTGSNNHGVSIVGIVSATGTGNITINGTAAGGTADVTGGNLGILVSATGVISNTGSGTINLVGVGGGFWTGAGNNGVQMQLGGIISSNNKAINITGTAGGSVGANHGVYLQQNAAISSGTGQITMIGTASIGNGSKDIFIANAAGNPVTITGPAIMKSGCIPNGGTCGAINFATDYTLNGDMVINTGTTGNINFGGKVDGNFNLTALAGTFTFIDSFGSITPLNALSLTSNNAMALPAISASTIYATTKYGNLTLAGNLVTTGPGPYSVNLAAANDFSNLGNYTITTAASTYWEIFNGDPSTATIAQGGLYGFTYLGCTNSSGSYSCSSGLPINSGGSRFLFSYYPSYGRISLPMASSVETIAEVTTAVTIPTETKISIDITKKMPVFIKNDGDYIINDLLKSLRNLHINILNNPVINFFSPNNELCYFGSCIEKSKI